MTRRIICILGMLISMELIAAPHPRPRPQHYRNIPSRISGQHPIGDAIRSVPWQVVLAGGAAASGVVFAYKVADVWRWQRTSRRLFLTRLTASAEQLRWYAQYAF